MIRKMGNFVEIIPQNNMGILNESLSICLESRKITSFHCRDPRSLSHDKIIKSLKRAYGNIPQCVVLEITHEPSDTNNKTMKTITQEVIYFNLFDANADVERLKRHLYQGEEF